MSELKNKKVFVTGASGFIGYRLVELLVTHYQADVNVLARDFGKTMRLGRLPVAIFKGDITQKKDLEAPMKDVDFVFHCAYGNKGGKEQRDQVNIQGTANLIEEAINQKVKAFVFLSTQSVYGITQTEWLTEESPKNVKGDAYGESKLQAEKLVSSAFKEMGLNTIILRPTAVYGPWAPSYGLKVFQALKKGKMPLIDGGKGICNAVYIDDLIQAITFSAVNPKAYGEDYLINGPEYFTWKDFYSQFESVLQEESTIVMKKEEAVAYYKKTSKKASFLKVACRIIKPDANAIKDLLKFKIIGAVFTTFRKSIPKSLYLKLRNKVKGDGTKPSVKGPLSKPVIPLHPDTIAFVSAPTKVKIDKAVNDFGYSPSFTLEKGFEEVKKWHDWFYQYSNQ